VPKLVSAQMTISDRVLVLPKLARPFTGLLVAMPGDGVTKSYVSIKAFLRSNSDNSSRAGNNPACASISTDTIYFSCPATSDFAKLTARFAFGF
jgi:hypothetical protein